MITYIQILCCLASFTVTLGQIVSYKDLKKVYYDEQKYEELFNDFVKEHNKSYKAEEFKKRLKIFKQALIEINALNKQSETAVYGINYFTDLTEDEFKSYMGLRHDNDANIGISNCTLQEYKRTFDVPEYLDYRKENLVTPVKNQGECGSCYAFSAIGVLEGQYAKKYKKLERFSEQQIVDCDKNSHGCKFGVVLDAFTYLQTQGLTLEADYPYNGMPGKCRYDKNKAIAKVSTCIKLTFNDEESIKYALNEYGPLSIFLYFQSLPKYSGGIVQNCPKNATSHTVLLVGYGTDNGVPYWLMKNSWGTKFGEQGYFRLVRGKNTCRMGTSADVAFLQLNTNKITTYLNNLQYLIKYLFRSYLYAVLFLKIFFSYI